MLADADAERDELKQNNLGKGEGYMYWYIPTDSGARFTTSVSFLRGHCQWENVWIMEGERRSLRLSKNVRSEGAENTINHSHKLVQLFIPVAAQMTSVQGENGEIARDVTKTV